MATVNLYKGAYEGDIVSYNLVDIDLEDVETGGVEITTPYVLNGTYPTTGDDIKFCRFEITLAGMLRVSNYSTSPSSSQNLGEQPRASVEYTAASDTWRVNLCPGIEQVPIAGSQPDDWALHWLDQYYTRFDYSQGNYIYEQYLPAGSTWQQGTPYYKDTREQTLYYTGSMGFFGVSRAFSLHWSAYYGRNVLQEDTYVGFRVNDSGNADDSYFRWKAGGAFGTNLFSISIAPTLGIADHGPIYDSLSSVGEFGGHSLVQMCQFTWNDTHYKGVIVIRISVDNIPQSAIVVAISDPFWTPIQRHTNEGPTSTTKGGYGTFTAPSHNRGDASGSGITAMVGNWNNSAGTAYANYSKYKITSSTTMAEFAGRMFSPDILESLENTFYNPKDAIVAYHMMPESLAPVVTGSSPDINAANVQIVNRSVATFSDVYTHKHVGDIAVEVYSDSFADWDNTSIYIHLPYVGTYPIDTAAVMNGHIAVEYATDVLSGNINAIIWTEDTFGNYNYRYEFKGNCAQEIPLTYREATGGQQIAKTAITTAVNAAIGAAVGGVAGAIGGAISGIGSHFFNAIGAGSTFRGAFKGFFSGSGGGYSMGQGALSGASSLAKTGIQFGIANSSGWAASSAQGITNTNAHGGVVTTPLDTQCYLLITRPQWSAPEGYAHQMGYPSDIGGTINGVGFSDFLMVRSIDLSGVDATDAEKTEINNLMFAGIYV